MVNFAGCLSLFLAIRWSSLLQIVLAADGARQEMPPATSSHYPIVDLSTDFAESKHFNQSPGAHLVNAVARATPDLATALVLEHGRIVSSYVRDGFEVNTRIPLWSCTKSWTSLLIGHLIDDSGGRNLSLNETLGEVFTDKSVWEAVAIAQDNNMTDVEFRKNVTIKQLLTMSSGLVDPSLYWWEDSDSSNGGDAGGADLSSSLSWPRIGTNGVFSYLGVSTILSYVIQERSGLSPRKYLATNILPSLGIDGDDIDWWQNKDGMEYSYHDGPRESGWLYPVRSLQNKEVTEQFCLWTKAPIPLY